MTYFRTGYYLVCSQLSVENVWRRYFCQSPARIINTSIITISVPSQDLADCSHRWPARDVGPGQAGLAEGQRLIESHTDNLDRDKLIATNIYNWWENWRHASAFFRLKLKYLDGHMSINTGHRVRLCDIGFHINNLGVSRLPLLPIRDTSPQARWAAPVSLLMKASLVTFSQDLNAPDGWLCSASAIRL